MRLVRVGTRSFPCLLRFSAGFPAEWVSDGCRWLDSLGLPWYHPLGRIILIVSGTVNPGYPQTGKIWTYTEAWPPGARSAPGGPVGPRTHSVPPRAVAPLAAGPCAVAVALGACAVAVAQGWRPGLAVAPVAPEIKAATGRRPLERSDGNGLPGPEREARTLPRSPRYPRSPGAFVRDDNPMGRATIPRERAGDTAARGDPGSPVTGPIYS